MNNMNGMFIYVFSVADKEMLLSKGYTQMGNSECGVYIFLNKPCTEFSSTDLKFVLSDTLTL